MSLNLNGLNRNFFSATSAEKVSIVAGEMEQYQQNLRERNDAILAASEASVNQNKLLERQLEFMREQNILLCDNYEKLKEMYTNQAQSNLESKEALAQSRKYNKWMMVISVMSMLAAIGGTIITAIVS